MPVYESDGLGAPLSLLPGGGDEPFVPPVGDGSFVVGSGSGGVGDGSPVGVGSGGCDVDGDGSGPGSG
ncbi:hypothetical protein, partial [Streptomyces rubrogriseus]